jgi:hypothetical protein
VADEDGHWIKHKRRPAVHGFKAHVGADATTTLVEKVSVTPSNVNGGRAGPDALPDEPDDVFADSAYRGACFADAVRAMGVEAARGCNLDVGPRRAADTGPAGRPERTDPPRAGPDRENLRHLEALLRPAPDAMARPGP